MTRARPGTAPVLMEVMRIVDLVRLVPVISYG